MNVDFLLYSDSPQRAFPLRAWPQFSRVGEQIPEGSTSYSSRSGGGGILKAGFRRPEKEIDVTGIQDEKDIIEVLLIGLGSGIIH